MAVAGRRFGCGGGEFPGATSFFRGTTHARFGSEVERKSEQSCGSFARRTVCGGRHHRLGSRAGNGGNRLKLVDRRHGHAS
jgi:hypothetical protein